MVFKSLRQQEFLEEKFIAVSLHQTMHLKSN